MLSLLKRALVCGLLFLIIAVNGVDAEASQRIVVELNNGSSADARSAAYGNKMIASV